MKEKLVLVGNGMAGMKVIEELQTIAPERYDITVFGAEPHGNYNRIMLSPLLAGEKTLDEIMLNGEDWYTEHGITFHKGKEIIEIDRIGKRVFAADGTVEDYDRLLLGTGSHPVMIPVPGHDLPGVVSYRDVKDVDSMLEASRRHRKAVVIGGGLLGLEAAYGLMQQGMEVTVVHLMPWLMERQLDETAGRYLQQSLEERGMRFRMEAQTSEIVGDENGIETVRFKDGSEEAADLVVMAVGIKPNKELAEKAGLYCERGVVVSDTMQTFDPSVYAVGECVQHRGTCYGLVAPLFEQAKVCANHLAGYGFRLYEGSVTSTKLKVTGVDLFSAGEFQDDERVENIVYQDPHAGVYKKVCVKDDRIVGTVLYGDTGDGTWYFQLLKDGTSVADFRDSLLFGQAHLGDAGHGGVNQVANLADDAQICDCNGVCKGDIVQSITKEGLFTLDDVKTHTKAAASCGSCSGLVEQLLAATMGGDYEAGKAKPMCGCTDMSHDQVREAIRDGGLTSLRAVFDSLGWKTDDGCEKCRPALNYYLISTWPDDAEDDSQARFVNERMHANIQKDGTFSVVPRIWGGVTTPQQLRSIAEVAEKYEVPTVKITGGQRIDLLGVKKEQLPGVWGDLSDAGFVSGHAYGKALRTVKTCVGSEWCRFGTQDSTTCGIELEEMTWGTWTPHKFKMAVSGCPRNCAEASIKDFGVVAIESGWELHVGGNGGVKVRATDVLCRVETMEEVKEYAAAFLQLYREEARYLERTAPWIERVGLSYVKDRVVEDAEGRQTLAERFHASQKHAQDDPWKFYSKNHQEKFEPLKKAG
ncbi:nitrite reductase large subunit NirB [Aquisalimonas asiatica]|uniref:Assimilatory nitrite reductase (NAD(P)H) large subunit n=1 Tax=Aquisalimonas asiatica TaxID=406100 RepID=A0A1H8THJ8_9GAMM|nr:nitrite reductase large subunit NirB [Aquisalimonas asiatica]SEO90281.1 assimilatory nitrite reductase (NAD(P)H) large subunit precursor [Aquisalimonas asiatica]